MLYARCQGGALARTALLALHDSMYMFRDGRPQVSFAHRVGEFGYEDGMGQSVIVIQKRFASRAVIRV
jgi:hypothetical protein